MSGAWVRISCGDEAEELYPGCIIGRSWRCDLVVQDPRVSEVHAVVSLRGGKLKLRRLGGGLWVHGMPVEAATLRPGLQIAIAQGLPLSIDDLLLPDKVAAICIDGGAPLPLEAPRVWISDAVHSRPVPGAIEVWAIDEDWFAGKPPRPLVDRLELDGHVLELVHVDRQDAEVPSTHARGLYEPLHLVARYDTAQLRQGEQPVLVLAGIPARVVTERAALQAPGGGRGVAAELGPGLADARMRRRWDKALASLREKLREARIRPDLVRSTGGQVSLVTLEHDRVEVES